MKKTILILMLFALQTSWACLWEPFAGSLEEAAQEVLTNEVVAEIKTLGKSDTQLNRLTLTAYRVEIIHSHKGPKKFSKLYTLNNSCGLFPKIGTTLLVQANKNTKLENKLMTGEMRPYPFDEEKLVKKIVELTQKRKK